MCQRKTISLSPLFFFLVEEDAQIQCGCSERVAVECWSAAESHCSSVQLITLLSNLCQCNECVQNTSRQLKNASKMYLPVLFANCITINNMLLEAYCLLLFKLECVLSFA